MKLNELIEKAQEAFREHGDIEVMVDLESTGYPISCAQSEPQTIFDEDGNEEDSECMIFWIYGDD